MPIWHEVRSLMTADHGVVKAEDFMAELSQSVIKPSFFMLPHPV
jgi:hypothetical protein